MVMANARQVSLGRETAARLWGVIRAFGRSNVGGRAIGMGVGLLLLLVAINGLNVVNSYVGRDFMTAIERRDRAGFFWHALQYVGVFALSTIAAVVYSFTEQRLGLLWRWWLTHGLVRRYLADRLYYRLQGREDVSNPDQRIADDVRALTTGTLSLCLVFLNGTFTIVAFSGVLWSISRLLFGVAVGYAMLGSLLAIRFGRPLVQLNYDQSDREATFRAELVRVRENAESVALLRREDLFASRLGHKVDSLTANLRRTIAVTRNLGFFTTGYNYAIQLIPVIIVAPLFINGSAQFGEIPQASLAFGQLVGAFSLVVNQFAQLSSYAAVLARLNALGEASDTTPPPGAPGIAMSEDGRRLGLERLTLRAPQDGHVLVRELSVDLAPGARAVIAGSSDATTALERAIAALWPSGEGRIVRPGDVMFLPERPYLPPGSIRHLVVGTNNNRHAGDDDVWGALRKAGVEAAVHRVGGIDADVDWNEQLSLGEQRLVEIARMLLAAPSFVVLTRLEANLGAEPAAEALGALTARGIGQLLLEDDVPAAGQFDAVVQIAPDGSWTRPGASTAAR
jgi:putative ATP-binding cassette transporter